MSEGLTPEQLDELTALDKAASRGPWRVGSLGEIQFESGANLVEWSGDAYDVVGDQADYEREGTDAALVCAMRNSIPPLLVELRALREENARLVGELSAQKATANAIGSAQDFIKAKTYTLTMMPGGAEEARYGPGVTIKRVWVHRRFAGSSLKDAADAVRNLPCVVTRGASEATARDYLAALEEVGAAGAAEEE